MGIHKMEQKAQTDLVYTNLKVYDCIEHRILSCKISQFVAFQCCVERMRSYLYEQKLRARLLCLLAILQQIWCFPIALLC